MTTVGERAAVEHCYNLPCAFALSLTFGALMLYKIVAKSARLSAISTLLNDVMWTARNGNGEYLRRLLCFRVFMLFSTL